MLSVVVCSGDGVRTIVSDDRTRSGQGRIIPVAWKPAWIFSCAKIVCIGCEEAYLVNMVDALADELLDLMAVRSLEPGEAAQIRRLEEVGGIGWHVEGDQSLLGSGPFL